MNLISHVAIVVVPRWVRVELTAMKANVNVMLPVAAKQFKQDLMLMLRSFLHERPDLFAIEPADAG